MGLGAFTAAMIQILLPFPSYDLCVPPQPLDLPQCVGFMQPSWKQLCYLVKKGLRAALYALCEEEGRMLCPVALQTHCSLEMIV